MLTRKTNKLYASLAVAAITASSIVPAATADAAPKVKTVKLKADFVRGGDLDATLDKTYQGANIHWYKSSVKLNKLGTYQTAKGIVVGKGIKVEKRVRVLNYPVAIEPGEALSFKQGENVPSALRLDVRFANGTVERLVRVHGIDTSKIGSFTAHAKFTSNGRTIEAELPYSVGGNTVSFMHTNDTHASLDLAPKRATAVKQVRAEKPNALLIDAGDVFSGSLYFNKFEGMADLKLMNYMKYDLMTLGNHEFDLGGDEDGNAELAKFIRYANFPFVSSNLDFSADTDLNPLFRDAVTDKPYNGRLYEGVIKEVDGVKVGFFGLTTEETSEIASPGNAQFQDYIAEAKAAVAAFEAAGVNQIVAVTHLGYDDNPTVDNDQILAEEVEGIDVIIGGHSHSLLAKPEVRNADTDNPTLIVQAYQYSQYLGTLDVTFDQDGKVIAHEGALIDVTKLEADAKATQLLAPFKEEVDVLKEQPTGASATAALTNPRTSDPDNTTGVSVRKNETALGNLITDGMLAKAKTFSPDVIGAIQNGGGIRAAINEGEITIGEVLTTLPFGNTLAIADLTGTEIYQTFERSVGPLPNENGGFLHVAGLKVTYDSSQPSGERVTKIEYMKDGAPVLVAEDATRYKVATNAFTAKGGDGFAELGAAYAQGRVQDLGLSDWENLRDHVASLVTVEPKVEGRIVDVAAE
ncbi:5'-nucleotidase C-terminal domain-containing protein [Exiguobacterium sp. s36]|uniref:bifunctional metallophosphatase/5'-nucleotidase n=1 Tax=Exiguobacterium sp. s36 TaxID=2751227 RepID=UPI001BE69DF0|nr:5'-nucleotidase C-terminal domain-containing protein [Exiguobacterium sp. s36]